MSKLLEFLESKFGFWLITTVLVAAAKRTYRGC